MRFVIHKKLAKYLLDLENMKENIISHGEKLSKSSSNISLFDTFCIAQLNRSLNMVDAFITLAKKDNYIASIALVRLHLDSLLRLYAIKLTLKDVNEVVEDILKGKEIKDLKDGGTKCKLSDRYLKDEISKIGNYTWVKETYEKSSGFVHFSDYILRASNLGDTSTKTLSNSIKIGSEFINNLDKQVACVQMIKITDGILGFINQWIGQKEH